MKASEAPEKIYVHVRANKGLGTTWHGTWIGVRDIEYVRKDAFIEKAVKFIHERLMFEDTRWYKNGEQTLKDKVIEDFEKYMEGE